MKLKEIIINQDVNTETKKGKKKLSFLAGCVVGEDLYFSSWTDRGFYKMNLQTGQCFPLKVFAEETEDMFLYSQAVYFKNSVWFIPAYGENNTKIDLETLEIEYIHLPQNGKEILGSDGIRYGKFKCCYKEGASELWLAPMGYNMFLKVDMRTGQVSEYSELRKRLTFKDGMNYFSDACMVEDKVWLCPRDGEELAVFDTQTGEFQFRKWEYAEGNYRIVRNYNNQAIFLPQTASKDILLISQNTYKERIIPIDIAWETRTDYMHLAVDVIGQQLFLAPYQAHEYVVIDLESGEIQADTKLHDYAEKMQWSPEQYQVSLKYGTRMICTSDSKNMPLMILDPEKNTVSYLEVEVEEDVCRDFLIGLKQKDEREFFKYVNRKEKGIILEEDVSLNIYCSELALLTDKKTCNMDAEKTMGEKILSNVR